jgi:glycosyltransferase involved in cell wall biosynthesis
MIDNMNITFILPGPGKHPVGGYKVVYEYANHLADRGHIVTIVHPAMLEIDTQWRDRPKKWVRYIQRSFDKSYFPSKWLHLDSRVQMRWVLSLVEKNIPDADVVIATAWQTAEWINCYGKKKGRKYYFIQDFEDWSGSNERVLATWKLPMRKIVISMWLRDIAEQLGQTATCAPNGLDFSAFGVDNAFNKRAPHSVLMLYHHLERKGIGDGLAALDIARQHYPDLEVTLFGVPDGKLLPKYVTYYRTPTQKLLRELYNNAALFLAPSHAEGWGLAASEAMMCGAAVVGTNIGGHQEFMIDGVNSLLAPAKNPRDLADCLMVLLSDTDRRVDIAKAGYDSIQQFTWDKAADAFEAALLQGVK